MLSRNLLKRLLFLFNLAVVSALLLSILSLFISPETFWMLAFMGLLFPLLLLCNFLFVFIWLFIYPRRAIISGIVLLLCLPQIGALFQFGFQSDVANYKTENDEVKILSFNVRLFDLYNWTDNKTTRNKIIDLVRSVDADIICFQEFFYEDTGSFNTLDTLKRIQKATKVHIGHTAQVKKVNHWGIATFSKYPIVNKGKLEFRDSTDNISIYTDLKINKDTVRVYNLHLESIRFRSEDYKALESITGKKDDTKLGGPQRIIGRMRKAYIRRARQTAIISSHIAESPYPVIVCGDFNDPPSSYSYKQISKKLKDSFRQAGSGFGTTYVGLIPFLRIDYILYSGSFYEGLKHEVIREKLSDHYPIVSVLKKKESEQQTENKE
ncbi:MAG: endonuclease/exonuclease/phosphatase family protein [Bacteroidia bacterium]